MRINVLTLFPEMIENIAKESILGKAIENGHIIINAVNIRDFSNNKHNRVDDYTYGGGAGMLMMAEPVYECYKTVAGSGSRCIYVTPQGHPFSQKMAMDFAKEEEITILCGHYEGIDERVLEEIVTDYVSIGDYVLTGGELAAMVITDAVARLVPEVLGNDDSAEIESFHRNLLEYPQYTRPEVWHDKAVPDELLSGNPKIINPWRLEKSIERTKERRPDLYEKYLVDTKAIEWLKSFKREFIFALEPLRRGEAEIIHFEDGKILVLKDLNENKVYEVCTESKKPDGIDAKLIKNCTIYSTDEKFKDEGNAFVQYVYTEKLMKKPEKETSRKASLQREKMNQALEKEETFFILVNDNDEEEKLFQEQMGLYPSRRLVYIK